MRMDAHTILTPYLTTSLQVDALAHLQRRQPSPTPRRLQGSPWRKDSQPVLGPSLRLPWPRI